MHSIATSRCPSLPRRPRREAHWAEGWPLPARGTARRRLVTRSDSPEPRHHRHEPLPAFTGRVGHAQADPEDLSGTRSRHTALIPATGEVAAPQLRDGPTPAFDRFRPPSALRPASAHPTPASSAGRSGGPVMHSIAASHRPSLPAGRSGAPKRSITTSRRPSPTDGCYSSAAGPARHRLPTGSDRPPTQRPTSARPDSSLRRPSRRARRRAPPAPTQHPAIKGHGRRPDPHHAARTGSTNTRGPSPAPHTQDDTRPKPCNTQPRGPKHPPKAQTAPPRPRETHPKNKPKKRGKPPHEPETNRPSRALNPI